VVSKSGQDRVTLLRTIRATFKSEGSRGEGHVQDVSPGGIFIRSPLLPPDGAKIEVEFDTPNQRKIAIAGIVSWNTVPMAGKRATSGFGVRLQRAGGDYMCFVEGALSAVRSSPE
jgi:hypothetical protein